jgi:phosphatidylserine/phosphatidylglycerophosphate/cardiolipin synthase-like enzyme
LLLALYLSVPALAAPKLYVQPRDGIAPTLEAIGAAKTSLRLKIYLFTDARQDVIAALQAATARGVNVRILLEREPCCTAGVNTQIFLKLREAGLNVQFTKAFKFVYTHEKSLVLDDRLALVSTANLTGSSYASNREYQVALDDPQDVREVARVFDADWAGEDVDLRDARLIWSPSITTSSGLVRGQARERLVRFIRGAKQTLTVEHQNASDEEILRELVAAAARGVRVRFVTSPKELTATADLAGLERLRAGGVEVRYLLTNYVHAKVMLSEHAAMVGSINLTGNSINSNRELAVELSDAGVMTALGAQLEADVRAGVDTNPFLLPPLEGVFDALNMDQYLGRIASFEGTVTDVEMRAGVSFLKFGSTDFAPRAVVFPRAYDQFLQPFPDAYKGKRVRINGRVQLYEDYFEVILNSAEQITVLP